jgi:hypothetical protein
MGPSICSWQKLDDSDVTHDLSTSQQLFAAQRAIIAADSGDCEEAALPIVVVTMVSFGLAIPLLYSLLLANPLLGIEGFSVQSRSPDVVRPWRTGTTFLYLSSDPTGGADSSPASGDTTDEVEGTARGEPEISAGAPVPPPTRVLSTPSSALTGLTADQKRLDPLVVSLTRMDDETLNAPRTQVPLWGELILDRSLFVLLPVGAFAVIGFLMSLYVGVNAQDSFVDAWVEAARQQSAAVGASGLDESGCRGLCSNQEQDLQDLAAFMKSLRQN